MKLIWTVSALRKLDQGKPDPAHTISAPNIGEVYDGFVRQFRTGTPWRLVDDAGATIASGTA